MQKQESFKEIQATHGVLYLVPTPIGNLDDMTFRAVKTLMDVDFILAEDTRHTIKLLNHFEIDKSMHSFHEHSRSDQVDRWLSDLENGKKIALVSDAGMPLINDPGHPLVAAALQSDIPVVALPGANAALTALIASGLPAERFTYYGFFPRDKKDQSALLTQIGERSETALLYESPYRIKQALSMIQKELGDEVHVVIARELTKRYEEYLRGTARELVDYLNDHNLKGEIVLLVEGGHLAQAQADEIEYLSYKDHVELVMVSQGLTPKEAIKEVAKTRNIQKKIVYNAYHNID